MSAPNCGSLTLERLHQVLSYEPETGLFRWKVQASPGRGPGDIAGSRKVDGYIRIQIDGETFTASRLAWFYEKGTWPEKRIDHRDRDRGNNKRKNLRPATDKQNNENRRVNRTSSTSCRGVSWFKNRWQVAIKSGGQQMYIGRYETLLDAVAARLHAERAFFTHHREN